MTSTDMSTTERNRIETAVPQGEPALDDMLNDPLTRALMASDGVEAREIRILLAEVRDRYAAASRLRR
jgi:hypothetical protein